MYFVVHDFKNSVIKYFLKQATLQIKFSIFELAVQKSLEAF